MWRWCGGDGVCGVGRIIIVQSHPLSVLGALRDIGRRSPSKNIIALGAFMGPDAGTLDKFPYIG